MTLTISRNELEQAVFDRIRAECGFLTDEDVVAVAVWKFATFLEIDVPRGAFELPFRRDMGKLLEAERQHQEDEAQPSLFEQADGFSGKEPAA